MASLLVSIWRNKTGRRGYQISSSDSSGDMAVSGLTSHEFALRQRIQELRATAETHEQESARHLNLAMEAYKEIHDLEDSLGEIEWLYADLTAVRVFSPEAGLTDVHVCGSL
jgi:hypothetical protein